MRFSSSLQSLIRLLAGLWIRQLYILQRDKCICTVSGLGHTTVDCVGQSRPSDMDSGKLAFMSGAPRQESSSLKEPSPQVLILLEEARFVALGLKRSFLGECRRGPRHFLCSPSVPGIRPCTRTHLKQGLVIHSSGRWDVRQIPALPPAER